MQTFVVEVLNEKAVTLLRDLENLDIIRLIPQELKQDEQPREKLSEQFGVAYPKILRLTFTASLTKCETNGSELSA